MAMDTIFATLACCLLAPSFAMAQTEKGNLSLTLTATVTTPDLNLTHITTTVTSNSTVHATVTSDLTDDTAFTSMPPDNETFTTTTTVTTESTNHSETSQSTTIMTPLTNGTSLTTTTPGTQTPTFTALTTPANQTTVDYISTSDTALITTANSSTTVNATSDQTYSTSQGSGLNIPEKNMTVLFSVVLGVFAFALVMFMFHRCKHKTQYLHQPLNNTNDADAFAAADDTLVISGGLYDGHPIYDNIPPAPVNQSQFRLEFLH